ncbi:importin-11-like [Planoprotostelium fungivorum]|uniref:Importin-11-like n=1 Tax=Planoprotostelium fungivorum TaxID=1890364 RepID=A0A2P6MSX1_9EUKA|nr:importin-11-like [Planoprotostelium fungivorum]
MAGAPEAFNPSHLPGLINVLNHTLSPDAQFRQPAETQLLSWESVPGYCSLLLTYSGATIKRFRSQSFQMVANQPDVTVALRQNAILILKNTVNRQWKKKANSNSISDQEKEYLRKTLLEQDEENPQIALQLALIIASICRTDYPQQWRDLPNQLIQNIEQDPTNSGNITVLVNNPSAERKRYRALLSLHHVIKTLSSKRLATDKREFASISPHLFVRNVKLWLAYTDALLSVLQSWASGIAPNVPTQSLMTMIDIIVLCLKMMSTIITEGIADFGDVPEVVQFFGLAHDRMKSLCICKQNLNGNPLSEGTTKILNRMSKLIVQCQVGKPVAFCKMLGPFLDIFSQNFFHWVDRDLSQITQMDETFMIQCMLFMKNSVEATAYQPVHPGADDEWANQSAVLEARILIQNFFSQAFVCRLMEKLIVRLFPMTPKTLEEWENDPEDFFNEQEMESWQDKLKPCAECLFLSLLEVFREWVLPMVIQMVTNILKNNDSNPRDIHQILMRDACYSALAQGSYWLYDNVDFESWFQNELRQELSVDVDMYKIIRARIATIIKRWVSKVPGELRGTIYLSLINMLDEKDLVVRLTAASALKSLIDDVQFYVNPFLEHLDRTVVLLFKLLSQVEECESKLQLLGVISILISQLEVAIFPYSRRIAEQLSSLWSVTRSSESYNLLRGSVLQTASLLLTATASSSDQLDASTQESTVSDILRFCLPIIAHSTNISHPDSVYLMEDGLNLWLNVLIHSPNFLDELMGIFPMIPPMVAASSEHLRTIMKIIEEYLLLGRAEFLRVYAPAIVSVFSSIVGKYLDEAMMWTLRPMEILLQLFPQEGVQVLDPVIQQLLAGVLSGKESDLLVSHYFVIFARVLLATPDLFFSFFIRLDASNKLLNSFLDIWFDKLEDVAQPRIRKLCALSVCNLLLKGETLSYTSQIINIALRVSHDTQEASWLEELDDDDIAPKGVHLVKKQLYKSDPVNNAKMRDHLINKMNEASAIHGQYFQQVLNGMDPSLMKHLQTLISGEVVRQ